MSIICLPCHGRRPPSCHNSPAPARLCTGPALPSLFLYIDCRAACLAPGPSSLARLSLRINSPAASGIFPSHRRPIPCLPLDSAESEARARRAMHANANARPGPTTGITRPPAATIAHHACGWDRDRQTARPPAPRCAAAAAAAGARHHPTCMLSSAAGRHRCDWFATRAAITPLRRARCQRHDGRRAHSHRGTL